MELLRKLGQLARQHYEKIALILAVIVLALAAAFLAYASRVEAEKVGAIPKNIVERTRAKAVPEVDLKRFNAVVKVVSNPPPLNLSSPHKVFNPVQWRVGNDKQLLKVERGDEIGPKAMKFVSIRSMMLTVSFLRASTVGTNTTYYCSVSNEVGRTGGERFQQAFYSVNETNKPYFVLRGIEGPPDKPTRLLGELKGGNVIPFTFAPDKPWMHEMDYEADLVYPVTKEIHKAKRKGSYVKIEDEQYKIIDITPTQILLSDPSNEAKRYRVDKLSP